MSLQSRIYFPLVGPLRGWRYLGAELRLWLHLLHHVPGLYRGVFHRRCVLDTDGGTYLWCDVCNGQEK